MTDARAASGEWVARAKHVPIEGELARRGIRLKRQGKELVGPCPKCSGTDRFAVHLSKQEWHCRGCAKGGDIIALLQHLDGVDFNAACESLTGEPRPSKPNGKDRIAEQKIVAAAFEYQTAAGATRENSARIRENRQSNES
jgi:DNA primase